MATADQTLLKPDHGAHRRHFLFTEEHDQLRDSIRAFWTPRNPDFRTLANSLTTDRLELVGDVAVEVGDHAGRQLQRLRQLRQLGGALGDPGLQPVIGGEQPALALAHQQGVVDQLYEGAGVVLTMGMPPSFLGYNDDVAVRTLDLEAAEEYFRAAFDGAASPRYARVRDPGDARPAGRRQSR